MELRSDERRNTAKNADPEAEVCVNRMHVYSLSCMGEGDHSVRRATTGSLRDALYAGIRPDSIVRTVEMTTRITPPSQGREARMVGMSVRY